MNANSLVMSTTYRNLLGARPGLPDRRRSPTATGRSTWFPQVGACASGAGHGHARLVNWMELESLRLVAGQEDADATLRQAVGGPVYGWVQRRVFDDHSVISTVFAHHDLDPLVLK
jgi:hypothetical protein